MLYKHDLDNTAVAVEKNIYSFNSIVVDKKIYSLQ